MGLLSIFKSSEKAVDIAEKATNGVISGIDKMFFTEEEKSDARQKFFDFWLTVQNVIANESTPTAISRRILAFMIMGPFVGMIVFAVLIYKFDSAWAKFIFTEGVERLASLALAVGATYFIKDAVVKAIKANK